VRRDRRRQPHLMPAIWSGSRPRQRCLSARSYITGHLAHYACSAGDHQPVNLLRHRPWM